MEKYIKSVSKPMKYNKNANTLLLLLLFTTDQPETNKQPSAPEQKRAIYDGKQFFYFY